MIVLCGDLNVNGRQIDKSECRIRALLKDKPEFNIALDDFDREFLTFHEIITNKEEDLCIDVLKKC